jgi:hypothetical protein
VRISAHTRRRWQDLCAGYGTVRRIADLYEADGILPAQAADTGGLGQRRSEVVMHEASLDLSRPDDHRRLLRVYAEGIEEFGRPSFGRELVDDACAVLESLRRDGAQVDADGRLLVPVGRAPAVALPVTDYTRLDQPEVLEAHIERINENITTDPAAAIGSAKELVESVCKFVLEDYSEPYDRRDDLLSLYKKTSQTLKLSAESVPDSARGSQSAQRALRSMVATVQALAELRNELGLGHGHTRPSAALERHAKLAALLARGVAEFLLDTWHVRRAGEVA